MAKLPVILGNLDVTIDSVAPDLTSKPLQTHSVQRWKLLLFRPDRPRCLQAVYLVSLPPASVYRLCYLILHSCEAVWCQREDQRLLWSGGVCAVHSQMFSAFHHLQQSPLRLPEALEVRQPKVVCKGIAHFLPSSVIGAGTLRASFHNYKVKMCTDFPPKSKQQRHFFLVVWLTGTTLLVASVFRLET